MNEQITASVMLTISHFPLRIDHIFPMEYLHFQKSAHAMLANASLLLASLWLWCLIMMKLHNNAGDIVSTASSKCSLSQLSGSCFRLFFCLCERNSILQQCAFISKIFRHREEISGNQEPLEGHYLIWYNIPQSITCQHKQF